MEHPLHKAVGECIKNNNFLNVKIIKDPACGGEHNIPLFSLERKSNETEYCDVDILILQNNQIRVIIEIEENNILPTQICGKFLTSALSSSYIHEFENNYPIRMSEFTLFIQILDESKLPDKTSKIKQGEQIEKSIMKILPIKGSKIKKYKLFYGDVSDFKDGKKCNELINCIKESLNTLRFGS